MNKSGKTSSHRSIAYDLADDARMANHVRNGNLFIQPGTLDMVVVSVLISIVAFFLTDYFGWVKLHWIIANGAALLAAIYTVLSYRPHAG